MRGEQVLEYGRENKLVFFSFAGKNLSESEIGLFGFDCIINYRSDF